MNGNGVSPASPTNSPPTSPTTSSNSPDYIEIGNWRIAHTCETCEHSHLTISSDNIETAQIFREDGTLHPGPRSGFNGWDEDSASGPTFSSKGITFGNKAVQIRDWRIRQIDDEHMSVSHRNGNVARIYRSDGTLHGNVKIFSGWESDIGAPTCAYLTENYLQIGDWRFGKMDEFHFSVSHKAGKTAAIYRIEGTVHSGPRTDFNAWSLPNADAIMGSNHDCPATLISTLVSNKHATDKPTQKNLLSEKTTSQESISEELKMHNSIDYHDAAPFVLSDKQIENLQLDEARDIHKNMLSDETTSQESNTSEEANIENSHDYDAQHTHRPPHHTEKDSLSTLSSSSVSQYFQTMSHMNSTYLTKNHLPRTFPIKP